MIQFKICEYMKNNNVSMNLTFLKINTNEKICTALVTAKKKKKKITEDGIVRFPQLCSKFPPTALLNFACDWLALDRDITSHVWAG